MGGKDWDQIQKLKDRRPQFTGFRVYDSCYKKFPLLEQWSTVFFERFAYMSLVAGNGCQPVKPYEGIFPYLADPDTFPMVLGAHGGAAGGASANGRTVGHV
jgi:hypothetical protein